MLRLFTPSKGWQDSLKSVAALEWNEWQLCLGISGRIGLECALCLMNWGFSDFQKSYITSKMHGFETYFFSSNGTEYQLGITPFAYCYAEIYLKSV